jgi:large subunit ribosomal protein L13e
MSFTLVPEPVVKSSKTTHPRRGRGFSVEEISQVELSMKDARSMGLIVDPRRKTSHEENVEALRQYIKDLGEKVVPEPTKAVPPARPTEDALAELMTLRLVKKADAEKLVQAGVRSLSELAYCEIDKVAKKTGITEDRLTAMVKAALKKV